MKTPKTVPEVKLSWEISADEITAILAGSHSNPFAVLGVHQAGDAFVARCFIPGAEEVTAMTLDGGVIGELKQLHADGVFAGPVSLTKLQPVRYRARRGDAEW
ncbi:1,4-alpha-glucan branching enzyme, partial [Rhizobium brockwellii]